MSKRFKTWLNMFSSVLGFAQSSENQPVTALVQKFKNGILVLEQKVADINATIGVQGQSNLGFAEYKKMVKNNCCTNATVIIGPAMSWCEETNNPQLKAKINYSNSKLLRTPDATFADTLQSIYDLLFPNAAALVPYGVTAQSFITLQDSIDEFRANNSEPREAIVSKKQKTELLDRQMRDANLYCKNTLDKLAKAYITLNLEYKNGYDAARKLVPQGNTTTKYRGVITNEVTGKPIVGALVSVAGTGLTGTSDIKGKVVIDKVPFGIQQLKVGAEGFTSLLSSPIEFKKGKYVTLDFSLVPAFVLPTVTPVTVTP